jgi:hypothetical protein
MLVCAFVFYPLHTRPRVQRASGIPCSLIFEGQRNANLGRFPPRDADVYLLFEFESKLSQRHCERSEAIHSHQAKKEWIASLRSQ